MDWLINHWIEIVNTVILSIGFLFTIKYQKQKIETLSIEISSLRSTLLDQSKLMDSYKGIADIYNPEKIQSLIDLNEKRIKLDKQLEIEALKTRYDNLITNSSDDKLMFKIAKLFETIIINIEIFYNCKVALAQSKDSLELSRLFIPSKMFGRNEIRERHFYYEKLFQGLIDKLESAKEFIYEATEIAEVEYYLSGSNVRSIDDNLKQVSIESEKLNKILTELISLFGKLNSEVQLGKLPPRYLIFPDLENITETTS
ncbi:MAG: hypothetical protein ABIL58_22190 [Pseudomonadota bacterium]